MKIQGNTVGTTMPRSDWAQTDPKKADYIKNKPDIQAMQTAINNAATAASNAATAASNAATAAGNAQSTANEAKNLAAAAMPKSGGTMTSALAMGGNKITGLGTPTSDTDAATKKYVDDKRKVMTVNVPASGWSETLGMYTQGITVGDILASDTPHYGVVLSGSKEQKLAQQEAFALIDDLDTATAVVTFTCLEEKPSIDLTVQLEVNR